MMGCPGTYSLDCYCDNGSYLQDGRHRYDEFPHQFTDEYGSKCRKMARQMGWLLNEKKHRFLCPRCNPKSAKYLAPGIKVEQP